MPVQRTVNELVNEALLRWVEVTGVDFNSNKYSRFKEYTEELNESRTMDMTGLTSFMLLRGLVDELAKNVKFSAYELITNPSTVKKVLGPLASLWKLLEDPQVTEIIDTFQSKIRTAAKQYGVDVKGLEALETLLEDKHDLAYVRRDSLRSIEKLDAFQFTQGDSDQKPLKFNPTVYEFWNVNSLVAAMRGQKIAGITLVLIRDPEEVMASYFVFAVKNGGTITILTDRETGPHPAYYRMSRRPDRTLDRRAGRHWFPYNLLELDRTDDGKLFAKARTSLVPLNVEAAPLKPIRELSPEQFVWISLMFELIHERYWVQNTQLPALSYTGEMVVTPNALVGTTSGLAVSGRYKPLHLPVLTKKDVTAETTLPQWEHAPTRFNAWMVERYGDKVPEALLNPVGQKAKALLEKKASNGKLLPLIKDSWEGRQLIALETLSPVMFGTQEEIEKDRLWVARMNQMKAIQRLALDEFERERASVIAWYREALLKNMTVLLNACAREELVLPSYSPPVFGDSWLSRKSERKQEWLSKNALDQDIANSFWGMSAAMDRGKSAEFVGSPPSARNYTCYLNPAILATVFTVIRPDNPRALATLCGVEVKDLPWQLQHWYKKQPYDGNHILQRLDPEDWVLENPWTQLDLYVGIALCKNAIHARRKALGLPRKVFVSKGDQEKQRDEARAKRVASPVEAPDEDLEEDEDLEDGEDEGAEDLEDVDVDLIDDEDDEDDEGDDEDDEGDDE